jgi:hypothetical protein
MKGLAMHNLNGDWDISIQFIRGDAQHRLQLEQDGETLGGSYHTQYSEQPLHGSVRGNAVQIQTRLRHEAQSVTYHFDGTIRGDEISGTVQLDEFWEGQWVARKR